MRSVGLTQYLARVAAWRRVPTSLRKAIDTRDERGRPTKELWAYGKCYTRIVSIGGGMCALYADRGGRVVPEYGRISFNRWDEAEEVFGDGKPHRMPMVPRRP